MIKVIAAIIFISFPQSAFAGSVQRIIFGYECSHATAERDGFICSMDTNVAKIRFMVNSKKISPMKNKEYIYRFNAFIYRFYSLGGNYIEVTSKFWPEGEYQDCTLRAKGHFFYFCQEPTHKK